MSRRKIVNRILPAERHCSICGNIKPIEQFRVGKVKPSYLSYCHACYLNKKRARYKIYNEQYQKREKPNACETCENLLYCKSQVRHGAPLHPNCENPEPIKTLPKGANHENKPFPSYDHSDPYPADPDGAADRSS